MVIGHTYIIFNLSNIIQFSASFDKVDILRGNGIFFSKMLHPKVQLMLLFFFVNPRPGGGLSHLCPGGGGGSKLSHLNQKLRGLERCGKSIPLLSMSSFKSTSVIFLLRSILR